MRYLFGSLDIDQNSPGPMKRIILLIIMASCSHLVYSQNATEEYSRHIVIADSLLGIQQYKRAAVEYSTAFKAYSWKVYSNDRYNAACAWAMSENPDSAFYHLSYLLTTKNYFTEYNRIKTDPHLDALHKDPRWQSILDRIRLNEEKLNKPLMKFLDSLLITDQQHRQMLDSVRGRFGFKSQEEASLWKIIQLADSLNMHVVDSVLKKYGWLGVDEVGREGNTALFLVIQHSNLKMQESCIPIMKEAVKNGKLEAGQLALLIDRIEMNNGRKQIYGSQIQETSNGTLVIYPITDEKNVDRRRAEVGLEKLADYVKYWGIDYKGAADASDSLEVVPADCNKAISLYIDGNTKYGPSDPPAGYGDIQEIKGNALFKQEHNTAWYLLNIGHKGELAIEIVPVDPGNDYDFALYKYENDKFCEKLLKDSVILIRNNLSRANNSIYGVTGIMTNMKNQHVGSGVHNAYSRSIEVEEGEKYMLLLDNIYPNGKGHTIYFNFLKRVTISGKVLRSDSTAVQADIFIADNLGNILGEEKTNKKGEYSLCISVKEYQNYYLNAVSSTAFIGSKILKRDQLVNTELREVNIILPELKKDSTYNLANIYFYGNEARLLPGSYPSVEALFLLMERNKKLVIQITGHVNKGLVGEAKDEISNQQLSEQRALTIYNYLVKKEISKNRMRTAGLSYKKMLYPFPANETEQQANRRVDIKILSTE